VPVSEADTALAAQAAQTGPVPVLREVRVHGNAMVPDEAVLKIAGVGVGSSLPADALAAIEKRLKDSGRFETVQVRLRYRSIDDPTDVALLIVVHEKPGVVTTPSGEIERPISKRITSRVMFLPILSYSDGYGFSYGARFSTVDLLGGGERLSVPLTWGGTRRAALEAERTFDRGPFTRILGSAAIWQRENPRHEIDEQRREFKGRLERNFAQFLYLGADASRAGVDFGTLDDRLWTFGADAALDTRGNPAFPANAVYLAAKWNRLNLGSSSTSIDAGLIPERRINRYTVDGRGYLRLIRQAVLAGRARYSTADAPLPIYERWLIGGSDTLRGYDTGAFEGDKALVASAEVRVPITSVISGGKLGVTVFTDAAKTTDYGLKLKDAHWQRGAGAGVFLIASVFRLNLDVARSLDGAGTHVHLSTGFVF
jgi:outer membrane protein assembly factor BamA